MIRENTRITDRNIHLIFITFWNEFGRILEQVNLVIMLRYLDI